SGEVVPSLLSDGTQLALGLHVAVESSRVGLLVMGEHEVRAHETGEVEVVGMGAVGVTDCEHVVDGGPAAAVVVDGGIAPVDYILGQCRSQLLGDPTATIAREDPVEVV